uniref:Secreted protein n=1 Tax=Steinernema glaseri TaxID=37863 RepID=A0A1I8A2L2_9BILA
MLRIAENVRSSLTLQVTLGGVFALVVADDAAVVADVLAEDVLDVELRETEVVAHSHSVAHGQGPTIVEPLNLESWVVYGFVQRLEVNRLAGVDSRIVGVHRMDSESDVAKIVGEGKAVALLQRSVVEEPLDLKVRVSNGDDTALEEGSGALLQVSKTLKRLGEGRLRVVSLRMFGLR